MFLGSAKPFAARTGDRGANEQVQKSQTFCQAVRGAHKGSRRELCRSSFSQVSAKRFAARTRGRGANWRFQKTPKPKTAYETHSKILKLNPIKLANIAYYEQPQNT